MAETLVPQILPAVQFVTNMKKHLPPLLQMSMPLLKKQCKKHSIKAKKHCKTCLRIKKEAACKVSLDALNGKAPTDAAASAEDAKEAAEDAKEAAADAKEAASEAAEEAKEAASK